MPDCHTGSLLKLYSIQFSRSDIYGKGVLSVCNPLLILKSVDNQILINFLLLKFNKINTSFNSFQVVLYLMAAVKFRHPPSLPTQYESMHWLLRRFAQYVCLISLSVSVTVSFQHQLGLSSIFPSTPH